MNSLDIAQKLKLYPELAERFENAVSIIESNEISLANAAEEKVIEEVRKIGNVALHEWAKNQEMKISNNTFKRMKTLEKAGKKRLDGTQLLDLWKLKSRLGENVDLLCFDHFR